MRYDGTGYLRIKTASADGAIPISGAVVRIFGVDEANYGVEYMQITDIDGLTETFALPAPSAAYSLTPNPAEAPYSTYRAEIRKSGYEDVDINTLQIFDGIAGVLPVNMLVEQAFPTPRNDEASINNGGNNANTDDT